MHRLGPVHGGNMDDDERQRTAAALSLCSLKHEILDPATAKALEDLKRKFRRRAERKKTKTVVNNNNKNNNINIVANPTLTAIQDYNPPDIPPVPRLHGIVGKCSKPFEKQLTSSDVRDDQSRLTMSKSDVEACLLPLLGDDDLKVGIPVRLYDRDGDEYSVTFKRWVGKIHVLTGTGWKQLYKKYVLKEHQHSVTIWMFYHASTGDLCFAVTWRELPVTKAT